jgi:glucosamine-6-phosphate deaminase
MSITSMPAYLDVPPERLGEGTPVRVRVLTDMGSIARDMAQVMLDVIHDAASGGRRATLIVPVGPVDQFPILAEMVNRQRVDLRDVCLINMDEYLTDDDRPIDPSHPLSFRGFMNRLFYDRLEPALAPRMEHRVFPDPQNPAAIRQLIDQRGGVDACFGGIGINGHIAFNEPPEPGAEISGEDFAKLPTRVLSLTRETRTINSVTVGGEIAVIPHRAVTVGMKECLAARKMRFYCNRPWQSAVVRRVLHGPITPACPASLLRTHQDATITVADYVAAKPDIRLR